MKSKEMPTKPGIVVINFPECVFCGWKKSDKYTIKIVIDLGLMGGWNARCPECDKFLWTHVEKENYGMRELER